MFRAKTVFILGAGASHEVGLPVGEGLKKTIADKINIKFKIGNEQISGDSQITNALRELAHQSGGRNGDINPYLHAAWQLRDALPHADSIDHALFFRSDDELANVCGKLGIVKSILEAERNSKIYYPQNGQQELKFGNVADTWFARFIPLLTADVPNNAINTIFENVTFISFNYDRCVEYYLHEALQRSLSLDGNAVAEIMKPLKIFHPYGSVGKLLWQEQDQALQVPYGAERYNLLSLSKQIKTFHERIDEKSEIEKIAYELRQANTIVFLGFAFHEQNLKLLDPKVNNISKRVYATACGISESNVNIIRSEFMALLKPKSAKATVSCEIRNKFRCADLFDEYSRSLTSP